MEDVGIAMASLISRPVEPVWDLERPSQSRSQSEYRRPGTHSDLSRL